jgi:hypothetical protein
LLDVLYINKQQGTGLSELINQLKGKLVPVLFFLIEQHTKKAYWGSGCIASRIL